MTADPKVSIRGISKAFRHPDGRAFWVLRDIDLVVPAGEFVCLAGPSGCGKSTILNILSGLDTAFQGKAAIDGRDVTASHDGRALSGYVFQEPRLLPWLTIERNLQFVLEGQGVGREEQRGRAARWLDLVGLTRFHASYPHQLSGGMQQRAAIARAFASGHDLLLMDEPFSALDEMTARSMRTELLQLWRAHRKTVIFVTHNLHEALFLADRVLLMTAGPGRIYREITVDLPRPRQLDDARLFEMSRAVTQEFLRETASRADAAAPETSI
jgi:NitT/TauT family transport system ATP-binding protein